MQTLNLIHVSDLHFSGADADDQQVVLNAFLESLEGLSTTSEKPDLLIFTGDVVRDSTEHDVYNLASDLFSRIADVIGLPKDSVLVCPGNHDASRAVVGPHLLNIEEYRNLSRTRDGANKIFQSSQFLAYVSEAFGDFNTLSPLIENRYRTFNNQIANVYYYRDLDLAVICLNTACLTTAGLATQDFGRLCVAEVWLERAFAAVPAGARTLTIGHHPLDWLNEDSRNCVEAMLARQGFAYLHGHVHDARPRSVSTLEGSCFFAQSGALFTHREAYNGYAIVAVGADSPPSIRVRYRSYFDKRRVFDRAVDLTPEGVFYSSDAAELYWKAVTPPVDFRLLNYWRIESLCPFLDRDCSETLTPHQLDDVFVPPEFERETSVKRETDTRVGTKVG